MAVSTATKPLKPQLVARYVEVWNATKGGVDLPQVLRMVADLRSDDIAVRTAAYEGLKRTIRLDRPFLLSKVFDPADSPGERALAVTEWEEYVGHLERGVSAMVPLLLQTSTRNNSRPRGDAAASLGGAAHPGFLPLLRAVLENTEEDQFVRSGALAAIVAIPHDDMIPYLISQLEGPSGPQVYVRLSRVSQSGIQVATHTPDWQKEVKRRYEEWWRENKDKYRYDRSRAFRL